MAMDVCHAMADGTGAYEILRTLLYYYCTERYGITLKEDGIRLAGDPIPEEEWVDPVEKAADLPVPPRTEMSRAINLVEAAGLQGDVQNTVYSIAILIEISAVNGRFTLDFTQPFASPIFVNAFLRELDENGITYDLQDVNPLELPNIKLPWSV